MVVGVTLATIALLSTRGGTSSSFVDPESFRKAVKKKVEDPDRRASALEIVDSMMQLTDEYDRYLRSSLDRYLQLVSEYETNPDQLLSEVIGPLEDQRHSILNSFIESRSALRQVMLEEEWTKVFGKPEEEVED